VAVEKKMVLESRSLTRAESFCHTNKLNSKYDWKASGGYSRFNVDTVGRLCICPVDT
jgi:hypothetical protein